MGEDIGHCSWRTQNMKHNVCSIHAWQWGGKDTELVTTGTEGHRQIMENTEYEI